MMKKLILVLMVMCLVGVASADIRYHGSGPWEWLEGVGQDNGWQSAVAPGTLDTIQVNWGGNTVTLDYATSVKMAKIGTNEAGTVHVLDGGSLTLTSGSLVGTVGGTEDTGTLTIDDGGTVQVNSWLKVGDKATGVVNVAGTLGMTGHLWMGCSTTDAMVGTLNVLDGGEVNIGGNSGLGTVNAVDPAAGSATMTINAGGQVNMHHWNDTGTIQAGSLIDIIGSGVLTVGGNRVDAAYAYEALGKLVCDGGAGSIIATYDGGADLTTITNIPEPATMILLGLGGLLIRRKK